MADQPYGQTNIPYAVKPLYFDIQAQAWLPSPCVNYAAPQGSVYPMEGRLSAMNQRAYQLAYLQQVFQAVVVGFQQPSLTSDAAVFGAGTIPL